MIKRSFDEIFRMVEGIDLSDSLKSSQAGMIHGVSIDSRTTQAGNLFVPIVRIKDGHEFVDQAFKNGASASLWQMDHESPPDGLPIIFVDNTLKALQNLARSYRTQLQSKVIGVTGSNGKTTVKDMVTSILGTKYKIHKTLGNLNGEYGLPLTLLEVEEDTEIVVLEMGMSNIGEISVLSNIAKPDIGIITMIGVSHMSSLGTRERIAQAKLEILDGLNPNGALLFKGDEVLITKQIGERQIPDKLSIIRFGESDSNEYYPLTIKQSESKIHFSANRFTDEFSLPLLGRHNVLNALASIAAADLFQINAVDIQSGFTNLDISSMRMERIPSKKGFLIINDAWNASPVSMKAAIETISDLDGFNKKVLVLGDMLELGEREIEFHVEIARSIDPLKIHSVYTFGRVSKVISDTLSCSGLQGQVKHFASKDKLAEELLHTLEKNDVILVKGSRGLKLEDVCNLIAI